MSLAGKKILIVDDDVAIRNILLEILVPINVKVFEAVDGVNAIWKLENDKFDAIITDLMMPKMSGFELIAKMKTTFNAKTPVFVISGALDNDAIMKLNDLKIVTAVEKPFEAQKLIEKIDSVLSKSKKALNYDVKIINSFVSGLTEIMEFYFGKGTKIGIPSIKNDRLAKGYVTALMEFSGDTTMGSMSLTFDLEFVHIFMKKLFGKDHAKLDNTMISEITSEACNQVLEKAKTRLSEVGLKINIGIPKAVVGKEHEIYHSVQNPIILIPVTTGTAKCFVEFTMKDINDNE